MLLGVTPPEKGAVMIGRGSWTALWSGQRPLLAPGGALRVGWPLRAVTIWDKGFEPLYPCKEQSLDYRLPRGKDMTLGSNPLPPKVVSGAD